MVDSNNADTADTEIPSPDSLLVQIRKILYDHIKTNSAHEMHFFMDQEKTHKRALVDLMRKIDNGQITSEKEVLTTMHQMADKHSSETLKEVLHLVMTIITSSITVENAPTSNKINR